MKSGASANRLASGFMSPNLDGKRMLVTGGSLGIGLEVSRELARHGAHVVIAARGVGAVHAAVAALEGSGHLGLRLDVSSEAGWREAMHAVDAGGPLHGRRNLACHHPDAKSQRCAAVGMNADLALLSDLCARRCGRACVVPPRAVATARRRTTSSCRQERNQAVADECG